MAITEINISKGANTAGRPIFPPNTLLIGVQGEFNTQAFHFDLFPWISEHGPIGEIFMDIQRPGEKTSYVKQLEVIGDQIAVWTVDSIDNAIAGQGLAQLVYVSAENDKKAKTAAYVTLTKKALDGKKGAIPDPYASYLDGARAVHVEIAEKVIEAAEHEAIALAAQEEAQAAASEAEASAVRAEAVFTVAGPVAFSLNQDGGVVATFTKEGD